MAKNVLVLLIGGSGSGQTDPFQLLQQEAARTEAATAGVTAEIVFASGFEQLSIIRRRLRDASAPPLDAVIVEPVSIGSTGLILKDLKDATGCVLLNAWSPEVEEYARRWGKGLPFGTVSTDHVRIGQIQGRQINALLPTGGAVLCVTGPQRSSAALERLEGMKAMLGRDLTYYETEAGEWNEADGIAAFEHWYALYKPRTFNVDVIAAQSDDLAMGVRAACQAVQNAAHREMLRRARLLGVDACPAFGRKLVDSGRLTASVTTPANTGEAIRFLCRFWNSGVPLPLRAFTAPQAYPVSSAPPSQ